MTRRKAKAREAVPEFPRRSPSVEELDQAELRSIVGYPLRRAQTLVYQDYARTVGELDTRPAEYAALCLILHNPGLSQGVMAQAMGIDRSGAVKLLDALESRGLVIRMRSPADRRSYALMPTKAGENLFADLRRLVHESDRRVAKRLSPQERETLITLLRRLYEES